MIFYIVLAVYWLFSAVIRIPIVESWSILPDGSCNNWWNMVGIRLVLMLALIQIAVLSRGRR